MTYGHGYAFDAKWEFWREAGKIRDKLDNSMNDFEKGSVAHELAAEYIAQRTNALWIDKLCDPWFQ